MLHAVGFDLGTSGLKAVLVDELGRVVRSARESYPLQTPVAGWAEQDPEVWWRARLVTSRALLDGSAAPDAVGLTGQMHSAVALGPGDAPLGPALLWNDQRTTRECAEIRERLGDALAGWTGNHVRTAFTAPKILWLRRHQPKLYASLRAILLPKDFLRLRLTGALATDVTDASAPACSTCIAGAGPATRSRPWRSRGTGCPKSTNRRPWWPPWIAKVPLRAGCRRARRWPPAPAIRRRRPSAVAP